MYCSNAFTPVFKTLDTLDTVFALMKTHATRENAAYVVSSVAYWSTFAVVFAYQAGQALAEYCAALTVKIPDDGPDEDLDAIADGFFVPLFEAVTLIPEGPTFDDLNIWTVKQLRQMCTQAGITWRNANRPSKHLSKAAMIGELL
jgi:hypothetical protein